MPLETMPTQGLGSNDCGVFMCCTAVAYVRALLLEGDGVLDYGKAEIDAVEFQLSDGVSAAQWGHAARAHIITTLEATEFDFDAFVANC